MADLHQAQALILEIDSIGGPLARDAQTFRTIKHQVHAALADGEDLGFFPLFVLLGIPLVVAVGLLTSMLIRSRREGEKHIRRVVGTAATVTKAMFWAGGAWVGFQLWKRR